MLRDQTTACLPEQPFMHNNVSNREDATYQTVLHSHTHTKSTHQAASVDTHSSGLLVAGRAVEHTAKVVVEVVANGEAAEFAGVRAWHRRKGSQ